MEFLLWKLKTFFKITFLGFTYSRNIECTFKSVYYIFPIQFSKHLLCFRSSLKGIEIHTQIIPCKYPQYLSPPPPPNKKLIYTAEVKSLAPAWSLLCHGRLLLRLSPGDARAFVTYRSTEYSGLSVTSRWNRFAGFGAFTCKDILSRNSSTRITHCLPRERQELSRWRVYWREIYIVFETLMRGNLFLY